MPNIANPIPDYFNPAQASVLDSPFHKAIRALSGAMGGNDPASAMAVGGMGLPMPSTGIVAPGAVQGLRGAIPEVLKTAGEIDPQFAPVGGESLYNAWRSRLPVIDPREAAYQRIMGRMGK